MSARLHAEVEDDVAHHPVHAGLSAEHVLHRAPLLFQVVPLPVVESLRFGFKPGINLVLGAEGLIDVPSLINEIEHNLVFHRLTEFVGMDVAAKDLQAGLLILLEQGRAGEADKDSGGHHRLHYAMQLAALSTVTFVYKDEHLSYRFAWLRFQLLNKSIEVVYLLPAKLVDQRAQQARRGLAQLVDQVDAAAGALDGLACLGEDPGDLLVELVAVGDNGHAGVRIVLQNPLRQQHHHDAFAAALRVPDNAALAVAHMLLRRLDAEILMYTRQLFYTAVEEHKIMHQFDQPVLAAQFQ